MHAGKDLILTAIRRACCISSDVTAGIPNKNPETNKKKLNKCI
jgi:hypothetical protein